MQSRTLARALVVLVSGVLLVACSGASTSSRAQPAPCIDKTLLVQHAYSECQSDGFWHVVTDSYFSCGAPDPRVISERTGDTKTAQRCTGPEAVTLEPAQQRTLVGKTYPTLQQSPCTSSQVVGKLLITECHNGLWEYHHYDLIECPDGTKRISATSVTPTVVLCELPAPAPPY